MSCAPVTSLLIVLSGPSGVGKDAVIRQLKAQNFPLHYTVTYTTRPPRLDEIHGQHYYFVSPEQFDRMIAAGEFLEWATVHGKHRYGTPREQVRQAIAQGHDVLLKVDTQGGATIKRKVPDTVLIFLKAGSLEELRERLERRASEPTPDLERRSEHAPLEIRQSEGYDHVVVNYEGRLHETVEEVKRIIQNEKRRTQPRCLQI